MAMALEESPLQVEWGPAAPLAGDSETLGFPEMEALVREVVDQTPRVLGKVANGVPKGFPAEIAGAIIAGVRTAAKNLGDEIAGGSSA